uniref:Uncharacterized protein n=1 Tax=Triticum urartu TaxID=4572 RepID=A0A8R7TX95_TRIUA
MHAPSRGAEEDDAVRAQCEPLARAPARHLLSARLAAVGLLRSRVSKCWPGRTGCCCCCRGTEELHCWGRRKMGHFLERRRLLFKCEGEKKMLEKKGLVVFIYTHIARRVGEG